MYVCISRPSLGSPCLLPGSSGHFVLDSPISPGAEAAPNSGDTPKRHWSTAPALTLPPPKNKETNFWAKKYFAWGVAKCELQTPYPQFATPRKKCAKMRKNAEMR